VKNSQTHRFLRTIMSHAYAGIHLGNMYSLILHSSMLKTNVYCLPTINRTMSRPAWHSIRQIISLLLVISCEKIGYVEHIRRKLT
jgi:hypothetical protein